MAEAVRGDGAAARRCEPLNAYERRIVHMALQDEPGVRDLQRRARARDRRVTIAPGRPRPGGEAPTARVSTARAARGARPLGPRRRGRLAAYLDTARGLEPARQPDRGPHRRRSACGSSWPTSLPAAALPAPGRLIDVGSGNGSPGPGAGPAAGRPRGDAARAAGPALGLPARGGPRERPARTSRVAAAAPRRLRRPAGRAPSRCGRWRCRSPSSAPPRRARGRVLVFGGRPAAGGPFAPTAEERARPGASGLPALHVSRARRSAGGVPRETRRGSPRTGRVLSCRPLRRGWTTSLGPHHRDRQPEGRGRQDHDRRQPRREPGRRRAAGARRGRRPPGQPDLGPRAARPASARPSLYEALIEQRPLEELLVADRPRAPDPRARPTAT